MKKRILFILSFLIVISVVSAIDVELVKPPDGAQLQYEINNIQFECRVPGAEVVKLFTDINGSWSQTGNTVYGNDISPEGDVTFLIVDVPEGTYSWNCFANEVDWASSNFIYNFQFPPNDPPECAVSFPIITLQKNTAKTNVLNLNDYFSDPENDDLTFAYSGNNNVDITLNNDGSIDLSPKQDRVATDSIYFRGSDGKNDDVPCSNPLVVTIEDSGSVPGENTAPEITPAIPEQIKSEGVSFWEIDLDDYVVDDNSLGSLTWTVENVGSDVIKITINDINHEARFEPLGVGIDNIVFIVTDAEGLDDEHDVRIEITAVDDGGESDSGDDDDFEDLDFLRILSHVPGSSDPLLEEGGSLEFSVEVNEEDFEIIWYVDGEQVEEDSDTFKFEPDNEGDFKISVVISKGGESDDYEWDVNVVGKLDVVEDGAVEETGECGDGVIDEGESCGNCPEDVICEEGEECVDDGCIVQIQVTGLAIKGLKGGGLIGAIIVAIILVLLIAILIIRAKNKRKVRHKKLSSFEPKIKETKSKEEHILRTISKDKSSAPSGMEPIIGFIQSGLASGDSEKDVKKSLIKGGWNRKQIKHALKSIKK